MVSISQLCSQNLLTRILQQEWEKIQLNSTIPVNQLSSTCILFTLFHFKRVISCSLTLEIIILCWVLWIPNRSSWVRFYCITEYIPTCILTISDTWSNIQTESNKTTFCRVTQRSTCTIFFTTRVFINTLCVTIVNRSTIV